MTITLTAAQLYELVSGPYTMPDGSTRRALWERVPETRPKAGHHRLIIINDGHRWGPLYAWAREGQTGLPDRPFSESGCAAALIRVAVFDWVNKDRAVHTPPGLPARVFVHWHGLGDEAVALFDGEPYARFGGETPLHALVVAAHTLADALGVPK